MSDETPELPPANSASPVRVALVLVAIGCGLFGFSYWQRKKRVEPTTVAATAGTFKVEVVKPQALDSDRAFVVPGTARAFDETKIYPRTTGYVHAYRVDIGDKVEKDQVLAEIDTPELDAQLNQAHAQLAQASAAVQQATAQRDFSKANATRYASLGDQKLVAQQTVEQLRAQAGTDEAAVAAAKANVLAQQANVKRLDDLKHFAKVTAPFAGTITTRTIAPGALVGDPTAAAGTPAMFTLVATDPVRVFVDVPQTVATAITADLAATITVRELQNRTFAGKITRSAGALDPDLHTMTTEIQVPNPKHEILPGMYVQASLTLPTPHRVLQIPSTALFSDSQGLRVAIVDAHSRVHFSPVTIERDTGATFQIATGLTGDERIVKIAVPSLMEGDVVEVTSEAKPAAAAK